MASRGVATYGIGVPETAPEAPELFATGAAAGDEPRMQHICAVDEQQAEVFRSILARVGDKWSMMLIGMLQQGPYRFTELKRMTPGISARMLTFTLRQLERDGLVERTVYAEIPPRVEYRATRLGSTLVGPVMAIAEWASTHQAEIVAFRDQYDHEQGEARPVR
ncbi:HxlR family transcriptional regulator [Leucobacter komagatae]|uniref:HxlR family transcriptional regulator n=1 Tax=Leucobacter komagatae TaxID=55969 RepID=A0A542Y4U6_9MICO|nr:HxlR family transcriptional regulator [Leucobacter komagatae]